MTTTPTTTEKLTAAVEQITAALNAFAEALTASANDLTAAATQPGRTPEAEAPETAPPWPDATLIRIKTAARCGTPIDNDPAGVIALRDPVTGDYHCADGLWLTECMTEIHEWEPAWLLEEALTFNQLSALPAGSQVLDCDGRTWTLTIKVLGRWEPDVAPWTPNEGGNFSLHEVMAFSPLTLIRDAPKDAQ